MRSVTGTTRTLQRCTRRRRAPGAWAALAAVVLLLLCSCGQAQGARSSDTPLPDGWSWYHDTRFPFQVPVPPNWQAVAFNQGYTEGQDCSHQVFLVSPGEHAEVEYLSPAPRVPEYISIVTMVDCLEWTKADIQWYQPLPHVLTVSGAAADFYGAEFKGSSIHRLAVTHFGGHQYLIRFEYDVQPNTTPAERQQHDLDWYMQVLHGFKYTGT
jgi:hypothetical protein